MYLIFSNTITNRSIEWYVTSLGNALQSVNAIECLQS